MGTKYKKHTFERDEQAECSVCIECGYVWGQEDKRGCVEK